MAKASKKPGNSKGNHAGGESHLTWYIVGAIVLAIVLALIWPSLAIRFEVGGEIFLRVLQMVVVPLVMASVMSGILGLGDVRKLGRPGVYAISYYFMTTLIAVVTGLIVVNIVRPGVNIDKALVEDARKEGEETVSHAGGDSKGRKIQWHNVTGDRAQIEGTSRNASIPEKGIWNVRIIIDQVGAATKAARARVQWSEDGNEFRPVINRDFLTKKQLENEKTEDQKENDKEVGVFKAGTEADSYRTKSPLPIPPRARYVRVEFDPQEGGQLSIIEAYVIPGPPTIGDILKNLVLMLFTKNLLGSMVEMNLLPLIAFSIVFAALLTTLGKEAETVKALVVSINNALMSFILLLMNLAPLGIFCLVAARFGKAQQDGQFIDLIQTQAWYTTSVLCGLAIHAAITLPLILWFWTGRNPFQFIGQMSQAILTAFSTASSTATLPVSMECAETRAGISRRSTEFVLPLGATVNMDGTALYEAAAAIFIAQAYAVVDPTFVLTLDKQIIIALTATLAAVGAAGIPEAGLFTMMIVLNAVGLPLELIGLILPIDWLLDRFRTAVNAFGDSVGAAVVDQVMPKET